MKSSKKLQSNIKYAKILRKKKLINMQKPRWLILFMTHPNLSLHFVRKEGNQLIHTHALFSSFPLSFSLTLSFLHSQCTTTNSSHWKRKINWSLKENNNQQYYLKKISISLIAEGRPHSMLFMVYGDRFIWNQFN